MKDIHSNLKQLVGFESQAIASDTSTSGEIIDTQFYEAVEFLLLSKTITDGAYAAQIWQSDDSGMSGAVQVASPELLGDADFALADDDTAKRIGSIGKKRYQQLRIVSTATSTGVDIMSAIAVLGRPHHMPVAD